MVSAPVRIAAAWSWRVILVVAAIGLVGWLLSKVSTVLIPVAIAALLAGLLTPAVKWLRSKRVPGGLAAAIVEIGLIVLVLGLLTLAGQQMISGFAQLSSSAVGGFQKLTGMLEDSPSTSRPKTSTSGSASSAIPCRRTPKRFSPVL